MSEEKKVNGTKILAVIIKLLLGFLFLGLGVWSVINWFESLVTVFKGCIGLFLILLGVITLAVARE